MEHRNTSKKLSKNWNQFGEEISTRPDISSKSKFFECGQDFQENKSFSFPPWIKTRWSNFHQPLSFTNEVYIFRIKWSMHINYRISYAKEVQYPSYRTHQTLFSYHIYNRFKFQPKQNFMHFLGTSAILSWNKHRLKINSLTFLQNEFSHSKCFQKAFFHGMGGKRFALARARMGTHPHSIKKSFLKTFWVWKFIL